MKASYPVQTVGPVLTFEQMYAMDPRPEFVTNGRRAAFVDPNFGIPTPPDNYPFVYLDNLGPSPGILQGGFALKGDTGILSPAKVVPCD